MTNDDTTAAVPPPDDAAVASGGLDGAAVTAPSRWYDMSRRGFLRNGSIGVAAAGVAASVPGLGSLLAAGESDAPAIQGGATEAEGDASGVSQGVMAKVDNLSTGEMRLFVGNQTIAVSDPQLAQRISQAVRAGQAAGLGHT